MNNYAVFYQGALRYYSNSGDMGMIGWQLIGDVNQFVDCDEYENRYRGTYPQIEIVLVFKQQIITAISNLSEDGALPVGVLFGKNIDTLEGETKRILCTDFVPQKYVINKGYEYETDASIKYKSLLASGLMPLGKYKVARGLVQKLTSLDDLLIKSLSQEQLLCNIAGDIAGSQVAVMKNQDSSIINIGVLVDNE